MQNLLLFLWVASIEYSVPYETLYGLAYVESSFHPYAVNYKGNSYFFSNPLRALEFIKKKKSYDAGLMQINSYWVQKYGLNPVWLFDPYYNAMLGASILRYCMDIFGNTWKAIDCYHRGEKRALEFSFYTYKVCSVIYGEEKCPFSYR